MTNKEEFIDLIANGYTINPVIKVVTSATFIRGVFGILSKVFK